MIVLIAQKPCKAHEKSLLKVSFRQSLDISNNQTIEISEGSNSKPDMKPQSCANPESFVRGGPTLRTFFLVDGRREDPNATKNRPSKRYSIDGVSMMAQH